MKIQNCVVSWKCVASAHFGAITWSSFVYPVFGDEGVVAQRFCSSCTHKNASPVPERLSGCNISRADVWGRTASSSQRETRTARNFQEHRNVLQHTCVIHDSCPNCFLFFIFIMTAHPPPQPRPRPQGFLCLFVQCFKTMACGNIAWTTTLPVLDCLNLV